MKYQQGDVILKSIDAVKGEQQKHLVLAQSVVTGHKHQVAGEAQLFMDGADQFLQVTGLAVLQHEEHAHIQLDPGAYQVVHVREMDWLSEEERMVVD